MAILASTLTAFAGTVFTGASFTAFTVTLMVSVMLLAPLPLSVTVQVKFCSALSFASATVLYFRPCKSDKVKPVVLVVTCVMPSALYKVMEVGILVNL